MHQQINNLKNSKFKNSTAVNNNNALINKQINNFFINLKLNLLFKEYLSKDLTYWQWIFLFNFRSIFYILIIGLFLLPLFSVNKHNISFYEFGGMIIVFIFLCSCYWSKIKKRRKIMNKPTIELTPYLSDTEVKQLANQHGLSYEEIRDCLTKSNPKQCIEEKKRIKSTNLNKKNENEKEVLSKKPEEKNVEIEEELDFGMVP